MTGSPVILCVGRLYCDLVFTDVPRLPTLGTEVFAGGVGVHAGGGAYITAAHLTALGETSVLSATLPGAPFRAVVASEIAQAGLDLRFCQEAEMDADPQVTVVLANGGDRAFITRRSGPVAPPLEAVELERAGITHLHIGELPTLVERPKLISVAREIGATISLDCGWDETLSIAGVASLIGSVDVFLPNAREADHLSHFGLRPPFAPVTVTKLGARGARCETSTTHIEEPAEAVDAVDTTGAGDAFNAGFLAAWLHGQDLRACLRAGNAQGRKAISQRGGFQPERRASETDATINPGAHG